MGRAGVAAALVVFLVDLGACTAGGVVASSSATSPGANAKGDCHAHDGLPDPLCTPGAVDHAVTPQTLQTTVCHKGYSAEVRPPMSVTEPIKLERMRAYGVDAAPATVELDHLIPLSLGGAPRSVANLWPQPWEGSEGARTKDRLELHLLHLVCSAQLELGVAQHEIAIDWRATYERYLP